MAISFNFSPTSNHLHPLQVENCDSNSRLVVDDDDNGKFRLERVNPYNAEIFVYKPWRRKGVFQFESIINVPGTSFCFICKHMLYVSIKMASINHLHQIPTSKIGLHAERVKPRQYPVLNMPHLLLNL